MTDDEFETLCNIARVKGFEVRENKQGNGAAIWLPGSINDCRYLAKRYTLTAELRYLASVEQSIK